MDTTKYTIFSMPRSVGFECPHCHENVEISAKEFTSVFDDPLYVKCPKCGQDVCLTDWEYD